ncbi:MAG TPA: phosphate ABC transporter, permease protein PstA, partial [Candidatus Nitrosocosmicus sp.]|nr:phosphate ABC transporter, permease protein PstA [Candidatus Nitrosocosmicus sp.]
MNKENKDYKSIIQDSIVKNSKKRKYINKLITVVLFGCVVIAIIPLVSILVDVFENGSAAFNLNFLFLPPGSIGSNDGGIGPAIQGTLMIVGFATLVGAPVGVLVGVYLSEYASFSSSNRRFAYLLRLFNDVMTGIPSVVI